MIPVILSNKFSLFNLINKHALLQGAMGWIVFQEFLSEILKLEIIEVDWQNRLSLSFVSLTCPSVICTLKESGACPLDLFPLR